MKITNKFNVPLPLAVWLAMDNYEYNDDPKVISATSLLKPLKSLILTMRATGPSETDVTDLIASRLGTSIHTAVESAWLSPKLTHTLEALGVPKGMRELIQVNPDASELATDTIPIYLEQRRTKEVDGWKITGQFDFVSMGKLYDIKSTGTYNWINQSNASKYAQQGSIYKWLFPDLIVDDLLTILYVFTDWSAVKARSDKDYPQKRLLAQEYLLMSNEETDRFIKAKLKDITKYLDKPESEIPECSAEELWLKPSVFKYYKNPEKRDRSTKNFDSYWEAHSYLTKDNSVGVIVEVKGEVGFCRYCPAKNGCKQAAQYIAEGRLIV